jgi:dipeptidyl-peptidase 4
VTDTFPRQYARTQRLTLGEPRNIVVSPDGARVIFARSRGGSDRVNCLYTLDVATGKERLVADPLVLLGANDDESLPPAERARRERTREGASGVVGFATDANVTVAAFTLSGRLFVAGLLTATSRELDVPGPAFDPRPDPTARRLAYVQDRSLRVANTNGASWELVGEDDPNVSWGSAEFVAAEEMGRSRGYWWSPDGERLAVARVDLTNVERRWLSDPSDPSREPSNRPYPGAGTANAEVSLAIVDLDGGKLDVHWDRELFPYLVNLHWSRHGLLLLVQTRNQRLVQLLDVDPITGATRVRTEDADSWWVELVPGTPARLSDGQVVMCGDRDGARRLLIDGEPVTPNNMQVRSIIAAGGDEVVFTATFLVDPGNQHVWRWSTRNELERYSEQNGVHTAAVGGNTRVLRTNNLTKTRSVTRVLGGGPVLTSLAEEPLVDPKVTMIDAGDRSLLSALLLPRDYTPGTKLPVLLDPYGGPHSQRVTNSRAAFLVSQWFADQGFAVIVADGRGTPGRGSAWERAVAGDLAGPPLEDQIDALQHIGNAYPDLDLARVGIRGWSFGGYLAALAVLRRPDVFHCAIAGAPVTDWRLYDTHYTERYLGDPATSPDSYDQSSLLALAPSLSRPLLIIHGLADDNVYAAHSLQLSQALMASGRPHTFLPLAGVSHMTPQDVVAENLLKVQLAFLQRELGVTPAR